MNHSHRHEPNSGHKATSTMKWVFIGFLVIAGYFLITEHRAHVIQYLPFALLLACPLLHMFMHGGHGDHGSAGDHQHSVTKDKGEKN